MSKGWKGVINKAQRLKMDGLPNSARSKIKIFKLIWLVVTILSSCACSVLIAQAIIEYLQYPVITTSRLLQEQQSVFPTVTICQVNPFSADYAMDLMKEANATNMYDLEAYTNRTTGKYLSDEEKQKMTDFDSILISCTIGLAKCNASDFEWIWHPSKYNCYRYNSKRDNLVNANVPGWINFNLEIQLYAGLPDYWSYMIGLYAKRGFYVYIQNATDYPFSTNPSPILVTPGYGVYINVMRIFYEQFNEAPYKYSKCRVNEENEVMGEPLKDPYLFEEVVKTNFTYSRDTCILFCAQLQTTKKCGCNSYDIELKVEGFDLCLSPADRNCSNDFYYNTFLSGNYITDNCLDKCPLECSQRTLSPKLTYYNYPSLQDAYFTRYFNSKMIDTFINQTDFNTYDQLVYNLAKFTLYFESLSYSKIEEKEGITIDSLIGTLGGHLHLFLGVSLLGFFEFFHLIYYFVQISLSSDSEQINVYQFNSHQDKESSFEELRKKTQFVKIDGLPNIVKGTKAVEKLCWITLFLLSSSVCVFLFVGSIREYIKYEVTTTNRIRQDRHVNFPSISICPVNQFTTNYGVQLPSEANLIFNGYYFSSMLFLENYIYNKTGLYMSDEEKQKLTNFDNILLSCKIGNKECNSSMFRWTWNPVLFNCYRLNLEMDAYGTRNGSIQVKSKFKLN